MVIFVWSGQPNSPSACDPRSMRPGTLELHGPFPDAFNALAAMHFSPDRVSVMEQVEFDPRVWACELLDVSLEQQGVLTREIRIETADIVLRLERGDAAQVPARWGDYVVKVET